MRKIRMGAPDYLSSWPLTYWLSRNPRSDAELVCAEPGVLAEALERQDLDAALIPSIEYLRGVGSHLVDGPALVARGKSSGLILATDRPVREINRIAVAENARTPVAVLRVVLHKLHGVMPDFCVFKANPRDWRNGYDGILLTGDQGIEYCANQLTAGETCYDLGEMWQALYSSPLVISLWAYNDETLDEALRELLVEARDFGLKNLTLLSHEAACSGDHDAEFLRHYFSNVWNYHLGPAEVAGMRLLEDSALEYQLIRQRRLDEALTG